MTHDCGNTINYICKECVCSSGDCVNKKGDNDYCPDHLCVNCGYYKHPDANVCGACECSSGRCQLPQIEGSDYCVNHTCGIPGCYSRSHNGVRCSCKFHLCRGCGNRPGQLIDGYFIDACPSCICSFGNCLAKRLTHGDFCREHTCSRYNCLNGLAVNGSRTFACCAWHLCSRCKLAPAEENTRYCASCTTCSCSFSLLHVQNGGFPAFNPGVENRDQLYCSMCACRSCRRARGISCILLLFSHYIPAILHIVSDENNDTPEAEIIRLLIPNNGDRWCENCIPNTHIPLQNGNNNNNN